MKRILSISIILLSLLSCQPDRTEGSQSGYTPVLMERSELEQSVKMAGPRSMKQYGKIYRMGTWLFINERFEGIHVVDNRDPSDPKVTGFITVPGNVDISMQNDIIYADNAVDLIALRFTGSDVEVLSREKDVFPELTPPDGGFISSEFSKENRPENTVIVKWEKQ